MPTNGIRGRSPNSAGDGALTPIAAAKILELGLRPRIWAVFGALMLLAQILAFNALPFEVQEPWDKVWHVLALGALTLLLWIATDGRRPAAVVGGVVLLGACVAH